MIYLLGSLPVVCPARRPCALAGTRAYGARGEQALATREDVVRLPLPSGSLVRVSAQFLDNLVVWPPGSPTKGIRGELGRLRFNGPCHDTFSMIMCGISQCCSYGYGVPPTGRDHLLMPR